jgi:dTDP-4-amino-4,6-dideoxygalactose transaminase
MEGIQGAVLGIKLKYLDKWTEGRRRAAAKYCEQLMDLKNIKVPKEMPYAKHVYHLYVIQVEENGKRDALQKYLGENGISTGLHYPIPLHLQPCFRDFGYKKGDFPVTEQLAECGLSLPMYPELKDEQIEYVCSKIREFASK